MKYIAILGSTGSIGTQTLEVVRAQQDIKVTALSAGDNIDLLEQQIREFRPALAAVKTEEKAKELALRISDLNIPVLSGMDGLMAVACEKKAEVLVTAIVGMLGIRPTIAAIEAGKDIALANKESDVIDVYTTDALLQKLDLVVLEDDRYFFPPYYAVPLVRDETIEKYPEIVPIIEELQNVLNDKVISSLNYKVENLGKKPNEAALEFIEEYKLLK